MRNRQLIPLLALTLLVASIPLDSLTFGVNVASTMTHRVQVVSQGDNVLLNGFYLTVAPYCPGNVTPPGPTLQVINATTDKPSYTLGEKVTVIMKVNKQSAGDLTIFTPSGGLFISNRTIFQKEPFEAAFSFAPNNDPALIGRWKVEFVFQICNEKVGLSETFEVNQPTTYSVTVILSRLPSDLSATLEVDGMPYNINGSTSKTLNLLIGTVHRILVQQEVLRNATVRYFCSNNSWDPQTAGSYKFVYEEQYKFEVTADPDVIANFVPNVFGSRWVNASTPVEIGQTQKEVNDIQHETLYVFDGWEVDGKSYSNQTAPLSLTLDRPHQVVARYKTLYHLTVESPQGLGNPKGSGYYLKGSIANFSVTPSVGDPSYFFLIQQVFTGWTGCGNSCSSPNGTILMDGPKHIQAKWSTNYDRLYILLGAIVGVVVAGVLLERRVRRRHEPPIMPLLQRPVPQLAREQWYGLGFVSDMGRMRRNNEDAVLALEAFSAFESVRRARILCAVADGVGGSQKGEVASRLALQTVAIHVSQWMTLVDSSDPGGVLKSAIMEANLGILKYTEEHPESAGMATTIVAALIEGNTAHIAHAGDSRAYLIRQGRLQQLTKDHSQVQELVDAGKITAEQARNYPGRNVITRALGAASDLEVEMSSEVALSPTDGLLLCTDGLWDLVGDSDIEQVLLQMSDPQAACEKLVSIANERDGKDNISLIIVRCEKAALNAGR